MPAYMWGRDVSVFLPYGWEDLDWTVIGIDPASPLGDSTVWSYFTPSRQRGALFPDIGERLFPKIKTETKPMLDLTKKYRTRNGREVTNLRWAYEGRALLHGEIEGGNDTRSWNCDGTHLHNLALDLVPTCDPIVLTRKYKTAKGEPVELWKIEDGIAFGRWDADWWTTKGRPRWVPWSWDVNDHTLVPAVRKEKRVYWLWHHKHGGFSAFQVLPPGPKPRDIVASTGPHEIEIEVSE